MNKFEIKAALDVNDEGLITGLAWPFGSADRVGDEITRGAFAGSTGPLPMLFGHNPNDPVGVWEATTETDTGLEVRGRLLIEDLERAREVRALVQAGAVTGLSIGFSTKKAAPRKGGGRTISALELVEISLVTVPAHPGARITNSKSAAASIALAEAINRAALALRS
jgi:HK97 family phage prohead protease